MNKVNCINYTDEKMDRMNITILKDNLDNYDCPNDKRYDNSRIMKIRKQNKLFRINQNDILSKNGEYSKTEMRFINDDPKNYNHPQFIKTTIIKKDDPNNPNKPIIKLESKYYSDYLMEDDEYNTEEEYEDGEFISYKKQVQLNYNK